MAAISALMVSDPPLRREPYQETHPSTTSHTPANTMASSSLGDSTRYNPPRDVIYNGRPGPTHRPESDTEYSNQPAAPDRQVTENTTDAMDVDPNQVDNDDSDNDTEQGDSTSASRKKKGQRFFCTGYPPCSLSFTRSEHLARHIRKHTGERPFQCHCNRRFSRLDNLRQHAQTVHVNEEIPTDSLAATGTRFQRQIRTDRVRPAGRPRTSTMSSTGSHSRGHSRNLSSSSIGSTSSSWSTSTVDARRRPPPLLMAGDGRPKLGLDPPSTPPPQFAPYSTQSPNDVTTPTSATFSLAESSPGFGQSAASPLGPGSRGTFFGGSRAPERRLSVPSAPHSYQTSHPPSYTHGYGIQSGFSSNNISANPSAIASPTSSTFSHAAGFNVPPGEDWRRRTWHPSTYSGANYNYGRPATSGLTYSQTPDAPQPAFAQHATAAAGQAPRLPGIESFDHVQQRPTTPSRQILPAINPSIAKPPSLMPAVDLDSRTPRGQASTDTLRPRSFTESDERGGGERTGTSWVQETMDQIALIQDQATRRNVEINRPSMGPPATTAPQQQQPVADAHHPPPVNNRAKRHGWYNGPIPAARTSPEDSGSSDGVPTPGTSSADVQPAIIHSNGVVEPQHVGVAVDGLHNPCFPLPHPLASSYVDHPSQNRSFHSHHRSSSNTSLNRLEALVAVATSEKNTSR